MNHTLQRLKNILFMIQEKLKLKDELGKGSAERTAIVNMLKNEVRQIFHVKECNIFPVTLNSNRRNMMLSTDE